MAKKKRGRGKGKGSAFEREIATKLSLWWTNGEKDDVLWRSSASGARATIRGKTGRSTEGQHGDLAPTCSIGEEFTKLVTVEIKRGYSSSTIQDVLDAPENAAEQVFNKWVRQAEEAAKGANTPYWWLITKRDRRQTLLWVPWVFSDSIYMAKKHNDCPATIDFDTDETEITGFQLSWVLGNIKAAELKTAIKRGL